MNDFSIFAILRPASERFEQDRCTTNFQPPPYFFDWCCWMEFLPLETVTRLLCHYFQRP
jgi:hypothetical protein